MACSSCLVSADADPTDAAIVASLYTLCDSPTATGGPTSTTGGKAPASATGASTPAPTSEPTCFANSCGWLDNLDSCAGNDTACACQVLDSAASSVVSACQSCLNTFNETYASDVAGAIQACETVSPSNSTGSLRGSGSATSLTGATSSSTHSGAGDVFGDTLKGGYVQFVMLLALIGGLVAFV